MPGGQKGNEISRVRLHLKGLSGSSRSFAAAAVYDVTSAVHFFILPDKESAAYFYNDLEQILDEKDHELDKKRVLAVTKSDLADEELIGEMKDSLPNVPWVFISSHTGHNIQKLKDILWKELTTQSDD